MSIALYSLSEAYMNVLSLVDEESPDQDYLNALKAIEGEIEVKAVNIANLIKSLEAESKVIKEEEERLATRRKSRENAADNIKRYLSTNLEELKKERINSPTRTIYFQKNPPSVEILNNDLVPQKYCDYIPASYEPRKKDIAKAWKDGEEVPGVAVTQGKSIRIR